MLARSSSSRRRRQSRSVAIQPQRSSSAKSTTKNSIAAAAAATTAAALEVEDAAPRSRRASMAVGSGGGGLPLSNRSPRNSIAVPAASEGHLLSVSTPRSRASISVTDTSELLHPGKFASRSRGASFSEHASDSLLSPALAGSRNTRGSFSVLEDGLLAPGSRSARGSFAAVDGDLLHASGTRSARGSFSSPNSEIQISVSGTRSARASFSVPGDSGHEISLLNRSPRESFSMPLDRRRIEGGGSSLIPPEANSGRRCSTSINVDVPSRSPRGSICPELMNKSPRGSISEFNRSPRGSIAADYNRSPRGSLGPDQSISPRGSIGLDGFPVRSPRTSPRGSLPDASPRGSIAAVGLQGSPRNSVDLDRTGSLKGRVGAFRLATRGETCESRRASSSVSQVSADDRRQLCEQSKLNPEAGAGQTIYGSVVYQLKDANMEASGSCDFTFRALRIVYKTATVTVILVCLSTLPLVMLIMGVNYLRECPKEPNLPVYMVVGGSFGIIRMIWIVWSQIRSRRYDRLTAMASSYDDGLIPSDIAARVASAALTLFLLIWFILGNYWTLHIYFPAFEEQSYYEPNQWCSKGLYIFSLVHLGILYVVITVLLAVTTTLCCCYVFSCSLVVRYK